MQLFQALNSSKVVEREIGTVEPQSYGLHSYGKLGQPDTEIE